MTRKIISVIAVLVIALFTVPAKNANAGNISLTTGWNLKSSLVAINVAGTFGADSAKYASVWKWESNSWSVYLPGQDTSEYATAKGFNVLATMAPGEGFWVNVTVSTDQIVSVSGVQTNVSTILLSPGWNLKGLTSEAPSAVNVAQVFGADSTKFASVWKWESNSWSVYLPGQDTSEYATAKGFNVLATIAPSEGFWVNVTASTDQNINIEQPPPVMGKVIEMQEEESFMPVSGVEIWKDANKLEETDSQGLFSIIAQQDDTISFQKPGYVSYTCKVEDTGNMLVFLKKVDFASTGLTKTIELPGKPVPKVITSRHRDAWIIISGMNLDKDITVAVSRYKCGFEIKNMDNLNIPSAWKDYMIIGGADIFMSDSKGNSTTNEEAGFSGNVRPVVSKIFGKLDFEGLKKLLDDEKARIYLFYYNNDGWNMAGEAALRTKESFNYVTAKENVMDGLYPFMFVLTQVADESQFIKGTLTGQLLDKEAKTPVKNAFVFMVGNQTYAVSDKDGKFSLPYKLISSLGSTTIFAGKEGYYCAALKRQVADLGKAASVEMAPFAATSSISGNLTVQGGDVIAGGGVFLRFPTVLDKVEKKENGISIGFDLNAIYKWDVLNDEGENLYSVEKKGKYFLAKIDSDQILKTVPGNGIYELKVTITHKQDGASDFVESTLGNLIVSDTILKYSLFPNFTFPSIMNVKSAADGAYEFKSLPDEIVPFLKIQGEAAGYKPSALTSLPSPQQSVISKDIGLEAKTDIVEFNQGFEGSISGWDAQSDNSIVKWQQVTNPDAKKVASQFLGSGSYPDEDFKDVDGALDNINPLETITSVDDTFTIAKGNVTFIDADGGEKVISATLFDDNGDGKYDFIESNAEDKGYYVWTESIAPDLESGDTVTVSYPDPLNNQISLLPAIEGDSCYWFGNINNGTYNDPDGKNSIMNAALTSPVINLTQYSNVTLEFDNWFEILYTGMPNPQLKVEIALYDDDISEGAEIEIQSRDGDFKFKQGYFTEIYQANPMVKNYYDILIPPPSIPETYMNYSSSGFNSIPEWKEYSFSLDPFAGHKVKIRFSVQFLNSPQNIYRGWGIDNIKFLDEKSPLNFAIPEPNSDFEPPTLTNVFVAEDNVEIDNPVNIVVQGYDNIWGIDKVIVYFETIFGDNAGSKTLSYDSSSGLFKGSKVFVEGEHGKYIIWKVIMEDYVGNSKTYLADTDYSPVNFTIDDPDMDIPLPGF